MSKGIAVLFKKKFGNVDTLHNQKAGIGEVAILHANDKGELLRDADDDDDDEDKDGGGSNNTGRYIYYLITKENYWDKPTYTDLKNSIEAMCQHCTDHKVSELAIPRIGCGLDGLLWNQVKSILKEVFWNLNIHISVYRLE
eukprot:TRINITY_DN4628_c0_g3_i1.p1 TRINITY_DN4628_c0_g3~~TRINITY_DN4628_c0_g3_i1.p1  ORF type:complete len:141 (-),score=31.69 TRINITY_DN4628_c0_g3_i1:64-486(-)